jgi:hypothetical protein
MNTCIICHDGVLPNQSRCDHFLTDRTGQISGGHTAHEDCFALFAVHVGAQRPGPYSVRCPYGCPIQSTVRVSASILPWYNPIPDLRAAVWGEQVPDVARILRDYRNRIPDQDLHALFRYACSIYHTDLMNILYRALEEHLFVCRATKDAMRAAARRRDMRTMQRYAALPAGQAISETTIEGMLREFLADRDALARDILLRLPNASRLDPARLGVLIAFAHRCGHTIAPDQLRRFAKLPSSEVSLMRRVVVVAVLVLFFISAMRWLTSPT